MAEPVVLLVQKAWDSYIANDVLDLQHVRPEVANSWQRCRTLNVDPHLHAGDERPNQLELHERLFRKQHLIKVARSFMDNLYNFVRGSGFQVVLTDETGFLLEVLGDEDIVSKARRVHLCPGGQWSESAKGTNAIGTAIVERRPVQVHAWEHFCQAHHFLTCSAAPIFDPDGEMIGVLDVSGDYRASNPHTLGMVVAAVNAIENQLRFLRATEKLYRAYRYSNVLLENMSDGLISINTNGVITELNARGAQLLGINQVLAKGQHVSKIYSPSAPILHLLTDKSEYEDREIIVERTGRRISSSASLLRDDAGGIIGAVAVFREIDCRHLPRRATVVHTHRYTLDDIIGESPAMLALKNWAKLAAESSSTVLIRGESGTGKELFAQAIHNASPRADRQFIPINSAALPENLIESELFGHEEGSFTGSKKGGQAGKFEVADGGTIFLDEIGDMPLSVQTKLLRVIQEKKVSRVGSTREKVVDIRIIAATHKDLAAEVPQRNFRQDLYYRLNVLEIKVPPLRERVEDIPALTEHLVRKTAARLNREAIRINQDFLLKLQSHSWPGNVRELENTIERAIIRAGDAGVLTADLADFPGHDVPGLQPAAARQTEPDGESTGKLRSLREAERQAIIEALRAYQGNIQKAAAQLGVGRNTLYRKMKEYSITP